MKKYIYGAFVFLLGALPAKVFAQGSGCDTTLNPIQDLFATKYCSPNTLIIDVIRLIFTLAGITAILFIVIGGFRYIISAGNGEQAEKGQQILVNAVLGLVIILLAYTLVAVVSYTVSNTQ